MSTTLIAEIIKMKAKLNANAIFINFGSEIGGIFRESECFLNHFARKDADIVLFKCNGFCS